MESQQFREMVQQSLDPDLAEMLSNNRVSAKDAMDLQMLRIMRGRPFKIELNSPDYSTMGWSDGKNWFPQEPGTHTTGSGPIPPTKGE